MADQPPQPSSASTDAKPSALARFDAFAAMLGDRRPAVFLDYDGTLTPIVERPDLAILDESVRSVIRRLAGLCPVAVVSGRDLEDVARHVGIGELIYAGSHGFDIRGPGLRTQIGEEYLGDLDAAEAALSRRLDGIAGVLVERKRFAIAVHTRRVAAPEGKAAVAEAVHAVAASLPKLRVTGGKEIHELRPNLPWDKGRAVLSLLDRLGLAGPETLPLYLGDDETDEDAFRALAARGEGRGAGIRVMDPPAPSAAGWSLKDPAEAGAFLDRLAGWLADG
ncbi:trehalose-phosphatase [Azospirillum isscasi]|uniref:Trehalose 6-phosphate phosphatase n=1 Tax=Azospirillum isscasi TaxID=3053926 RepID=A0ABU0WCD9_9PROT|nr:trehalose-phosphatase [Azospirillum isscasi]MDQ2101853.1 trehalose-phosphatase [Azospirillum isscasi]